MLLRALRVLVGYLLACIAFALVLVAFVFTPGEFASLPAGAATERLAMAAFQLLASFIQVAIFAAPAALVAAGIAEWRGVGAWFYYTAAALLIAGIGFLAQYASELQGAPTIVNGYAVVAFLAGGIAAGLVYWLVAGRRSAPRNAVAPSSAA